MSRAKKYRAFKYQSDNPDNELFRARAMIKFVQDWADGQLDDAVDGDILFGLSVTLEAAESIIQNVEESIANGELQYVGKTTA